LHFFALSVTTSLKIPGAVIPRRVFTRPGHFSDMANAMTNVRFEGESGSGAGLVDAGAASPVLPFRHSKVPWGDAVARHRRMARRQNGLFKSSPMRSSAGPATGAWPSDRRDSNAVPIRDKLAERAG
jgi:hypothetical protein